MFFTECLFVKSHSELIVESLIISDLFVDFMEKIGMIVLWLLKKEILDDELDIPASKVKKIRSKLKEILGHIDQYERQIK